MAVITFASSKGGVGKTTSALTLASVIAHSGTNVVLVDGDPNTPLKQWATEWPDLVPKRLEVIAPTSREIIRAIDAAAERSPVVIVDLEGSKNYGINAGIGRADLALIPMQASQLDANQAAAIVELIEEKCLEYRRQIPYRVFFSRSSAAIISKSEKALQSELAAADIKVMACRLMEREAFRLPFRIGGTLYELDKNAVRNPAQAIINAEDFAAEIEKILTEIMLVSEAR